MYAERAPFSGRLVNTIEKIMSELRLLMIDASTPRKQRKIDTVYSLGCP
jgi:hypothetical protein